MNLVLDLREPHRGVQIAQSAFAFLDLRLEQVDRIAVLGVAFAAFLELDLEELVLVAVEHVRDEQLVEIGVEFLVAAEKSRVEDRSLFLQVFVGEPHAIFRGANAVSDSKSGVPESVQHNLSDNFDVWAALVVVEKEQINVGLRIEFAASVPAAGNDSDFLIELGETPVVVRIGIEKERANEIV